MKSNKILLLTVVSYILVLLSSCGSQKHRITYSDLLHPKREFRGAWLSTAWQSRYRTMNPSEMKRYFSQSLDELQSAGINAIIFQVRPQADAFYKSKYEPWSAHLSGTQGVAPANGFDPLAYLIEECHNRGMELHAWLNPYRVTSSVNDLLVEDHLYFREPDRFVEYGEKIYFDPGIPDNRKYIRSVVKDILINYNVDAIHMDDYFYPYPIAGENFPDDISFERYGRSYSVGEKNDWRRSNVNKLIKEIKETITSVKPWVRFGISPFGIYRNEKNTSDGSGSNTSGLEGYSALYADVKLWVKEGWIDYNMPQLYWEIGHTAADYTTLIRWWNENNYGKPLYIGQDVKRTMNAPYKNSPTQLDRKMELARGSANVSGNCFWPAYELLDNYNDITDELKSSYHRYPALIPAYTHMHSRAPKTVGSLNGEIANDGKMLLTWSSNHVPNDPETAQYYVVYRFERGEKENIENAQHIVDITSKTYYVLPYEGGYKEYKYVVTAVDAFHNESKGKAKKVKL